jgi:hypothetical protein
MDGVTEPRFYEEEHSRREWFRSLFEFIRRRTKIVNKSSDYTVEADVWVVRVDATSAAVTVTLPLSASWRGREIRVKKMDSSGNAVTVSRSGSDVVDGATSASLASQYDAVTIVADGTTNWDIF